MPAIHEVATITAKGQITLPKPIRQALGVVLVMQVNVARNGGLVCASGRLPQCARCFAARGTGVFFLGSWREVAGMTVRKWTILVVVCGFGALRYMFFITCPASDCLCGSPPLRAIVFVNWGHKLGSDPDLTK